MLTIKATTEEFYAFVAEHDDQIFELISGEIVEVPSNPFVSEIANLISFFIRLFMREHNIQGHVTGADGGYYVNGDLYAPDVAFISVARQPELAKKGFNPNPPELAIEVISDPANMQEQETLRRKVVNYLAVGTVVWVVDPFEKTVDVYGSDPSVQIHGVDGVIKGGKLLPGFELAVKDIFPKEQERDDERRTGEDQD